MKALRTLSCLLLFAMSFSHFATGQTNTIPPKSFQPLIVSATWLERHLNDPKLVLLHVGLEEEYADGHIPGARYISRAHISTPRGQGLTLELPSVAVLDSTFEEFGISDDSRIVVYFGKDWVTPTARVYLTLDYLGLGSRTSILDGGLPAWKKEGNPVSTDLPVVKRGTLTPRQRNDVVVDFKWVHEHMRRPGTSLIDTRDAGFYQGTRPNNMARSGHIPGARNIPFAEFLDEELKFKDRESLRDLFSKSGTKEDDIVVTYCHIGQQASLGYFAARYLGYNARLYDGSFEDWSARANLPVIGPADGPAKKK